MTAAARFCASMPVRLASTWVSPIAAISGADTEVHLAKAFKFDGLRRAVGLAVHDGRLLLILRLRLLHRLLLGLSRLMLLELLHGMRPPIAALFHRCIQPSHRSNTCELDKVIAHRPEALSRPKLAGIIAEC